MTRSERIPVTLNEANDSDPETPRPIGTKWQRRPSLPGEVPSLTG